MRTLLAFLPLSVLLVGAEPAVPAQPASTTPTAADLWQQGQDAMLLDKPDQAILCYRESLRLDPTLARNFLSLAAAHLQKNEDEKALPWLARYVAVQPDHVVVRSHYAELLCKVGQTDAAQVQFQRFVADVQRTDRQPVPRLIQAHTRLMEIAARRGDAHGEQLHRGIGLYWLAWLKAERRDEEDDSAESLLCQATVYLQQARRARPESARACWYLHQVWKKLGQQETAQKWLRETTQSALLPGHDLTQSEVHDLELARAARP